MELPAREPLLQLVGHYGRLHARLRHELGPAKLVLPNAEFFPDRFDGSAAASQRLLRRMQKHAAIDDIPVRIVVGDSGVDGAASCSSGGCGVPTVESSDGEPRLAFGDGGWVLRLSEAEVGHPIALTTTIARGLGALFLEETRPEEGSLPEPLMLNQELAAVMLGFGVLLLEGSYLYSKSCGGPRVAQLTSLSAPELAACVALFATSNHLKLKRAIRSCSTTQRSLLKDADDLLRGNPKLARWVRTATVDEPPLALELSPPKAALFAGWFESNSRAPLDDDFEAMLQGDLDPAQLAQFAPSRRTSARPPKPAPDDELKALVAEALDS